MIWALFAAFSEASRRFAMGIEGEELIIE